MSLVATPYLRTDALSSGAITTNLNLSAQGAAGAPIVGYVAQFNITAVSGTTPTLTPTLQDSPDGGITWYAVPLGTNPVINSSGVAAANISATGTYSVRFNASATPVSSLVRLVLTTGGTNPSFTGTIYGTVLTV